MITWPDALWIAFAAGVLLVLWECVHTWRSNRKLLKILRELERKNLDLCAEMCKEDREMLEEFDRERMERGPRAPAQTSKPFSAMADLIDECTYDDERRQRLRATLARAWRDRFS